MYDQLIVDEILNTQKLSDELVLKLKEKMVDLDSYLTQIHKDFQTVYPDEIQTFIDLDDDENVVWLVTMYRYFHKLDRKDIQLHFKKLLGGLGVFDHLFIRLKKYAKEDYLYIKEHFHQPPLGTSPEEVSIYTENFMNLLKDRLDEAVYKKVLSGNNHGIPKEAMLGEKRFNDEADSLVEYLKERHSRKVTELRSYYNEDKIWFEQIVTKEMIDLIESNQEMLSAVLENDKLYVTKLPYDTNQFLHATSEIEKQYYACHCPFARDNILTGNQNIDSDWCYCSAGFAKYPFEIIFDQELEVRVLESAIGDSTRCRFEIDLSHVNYKK